MPSDRTMVTELGTALGMLGFATVDEALRSRLAVMHSLSPESWNHLQHLRGEAPRRRVPRRLGERTGLPRRAGRPPRQATAGRRMEGDRAGAG